ncbi:MAG TPA: DsbA family protein [Vicinamibacteria bacterium]|nr:DsbA family protein [Vicinamibacteria bacterium]
MKKVKVGLILSAVATLLATGTGVAFSQERLVRGTEPARGADGAPVTMVMFCDFQCPQCAEAQPVVDRLLSAYPSEVRLVYRHFPVERIHADAGRAAEAALCAHDQGRFWDMYRSMLANQTELGRSGLLRQAGDLGLDSAAFQRCLDTSQHRADWRRDQTDGAALGVTGTPTFFVNGTFIEGAALSQLDQAIRAALER